MAIYLGQLPPAEIARLKAELAETLLANFCYPRFFDPRTQSLRMRPVDRAKRHEVWLYLSAVDFTSWSRVDLMSPEFQHQIERLFILFVQRNRSFFGEQGRRRMLDIRVQISTCAASVVQGLRGHITGQKVGTHPFGSPRPVVSWLTTNVTGRPELNWEQIAPSTKMLQQQVQEVRGEIKPVTSVDPRSTQGASRRSTRSQPLVGTIAPQEAEMATATQLTAPTTPINTRNIPPATGNGKSSAVPLAPAASVVAPTAPTSPMPMTQAPSVPLTASGPSVTAAPPQQAAAVSSPSSSFAATAPSPVARRVETPSAPSIESPISPSRSGTPVRGASSSSLSTATAETGMQPTAPVSAVSAPPRGVPQAPAQATPPPAGVRTGSTDGGTLLVGEDDIAIFEQMRHQLMVWLRVEAITAGIEISQQTPASQLLELLRQNSRLDETRLQVVSSLLNLANQVIKTGLVSMLDYKQALMFHLMHTRR